jgi:hypothetical protein
MGQLETNPKEHKKSESGEEGLAVLLTCSKFLQSETRNKSVGII